MKLNWFYTLLFISIALAYSCENQKNDDTSAPKEAKAPEVKSNSNTNRAEEPVRQSPREIAKYVDRDFNITMMYGSPRVHERQVWGGLVPFNEVWRAGANETTSIEFNKEVKINNHTIEVGTYAFFIIPKANNKWTVILNEEWSKEIHNVWGAFNYKKEKDVCRFDIKTNTDSSKLVEELYYSVNEDFIVFKWEYKELKIPYTTL